MNTSLHIDEVRDYDGSVLATLEAQKPCDDATCNPGNCEVAHHDIFRYGE